MPQPLAARPLARHATIVCARKELVRELPLNVRHGVGVLNRRQRRSHAQATRR